MAHIDYLTVMRHSLFIVFLILTISSFSQEDSLRVLQLDATTVSYKKEVAFGDNAYFITDFHINDKGRFVLMKRFSKYRVFALNEEMHPTAQLDIDFKVKRLKFYEDCLGFLHLMSSDSMYQLELLSDTNLVIWERNSLTLYYRYFKNCVASNTRGMISERKLNMGQTLAYYQQLRHEKTKKRIFTVEDSTERSILERQLKDLPNGALFDAVHLAEVDSALLKKARRGFNESIFFFRHVVKPIYNPLFVRRDTTYIFDHLNDRVVQLNDTGAYIRETPIDYHHAKYWEKKVLFDRNHERFYTMEEKGGVQTYCMLSSDNFKSIRRVKITEHAYPEKVIIHRGYAYYLYKEDLEDNLNKLFRQRLI